MIVACTGMIRSGSTLQYNLARGVVETARRGTGEGYHEPAASPAQWERWGDDGVMHVVKAHQLPTDAAELCRTGRLAVLYISRDLRDVAASAARVWSSDRRDLVRRLDEAVSISEEVRALPRSLRQKYEEVTRQPARAAQEIAAFLDLPLSDDQAARVAEGASPETAGTRSTALDEGAVSTLRRLARAVGIPRPVRRATARTLRRLGLFDTRYDRELLVHPGHISEGTEPPAVGEEVLDEIARRYSEWLAREGYAARSSHAEPRMNGAP